MKKFSLLILIMMMIGITPTWSQARYGESLCKDPDYTCIKIKKGENWGNLFPNPEAEDMVRRINRMNITLRVGMTIAIPKNLDYLTIYDVSPFPRYIEAEGEKTIFVSQKKLAWGAYNEEGELLWWGPISSGKDGCIKQKGGCSTPAGSYRIIRKQDSSCISSAYPRRANGQNGGAEMPFCMHFFRGYALHGSATVPGFRASHGCVRLFTEDARWLNEEFIDLPGNGSKGTRVIIDEA